MPHPVAALILQGRSDFNTLMGFDAELVRCLSNMKIEPILVNLMDGSGAVQTINKALNDYTPQKIITAFSFSGIGTELGDGTPIGNLWQHIKVPMLSWMMDHPCYILQRQMLKTPAMARLYPSMDYLGFQRDYIKAGGRNIHCRMGAFTHGVKATRREPKKGAAPLIIFAKTLGNLDELKQKWSCLPAHMIRVLCDAVDHYWGETERCSNVVPSVLTAASAAGLELENDLPLFCFFISQVDQYFRMHKASLLIKELIQLPVKIYGKGIEHIKSNNTRATLLPPTDYFKLMEEYRTALAVISMNPNAGDDCHDRNYNAFGAGALPISDINPWWEKNFPALQPYSYDFRDKPITAAIEKVMADPVAAADISWAVGERMRTDRPVEKMVKEAVDWALMQRYFEFDFLSPIEGFIRSDLMTAKP